MGVQSVTFLGDLPIISNFIGLWNFLNSGLYAGGNFKTYSSYSFSAISEISKYPGNVGTRAITFLGNLPQMLRNLFHFETSI